MTPAEDAALIAHLHMAPAVNGIQYKSSFMGALRDARDVAERHVETGLVLPGAASGSWLAALGYLAEWEAGDGVCPSCEASRPSSCSMTLRWFGDHASQELATPSIPTTSASAPTCAPV
jgi:hypothetical protein